MDENREISSAPSAVGEGRSVKAQSRTTDMHVLEKSDCAVVPVNRPNKGAATSCGGGGGKGADEGEHRSATHAPDTEWERHVPGAGRCA